MAKTTMIKAITQALEDELKRDKMFWYLVKMLVEMVVFSVLLMAYKKKSVKIKSLIRP